MTLRLATLSLLILYPIAWFAPLMRAGFLPIFCLSEISVITGLQSLWKSDIFLALIVTIFAPYIKTIGTALKVPTRDEKTQNSSTEFRTSRVTPM